MQLHWWSGLKRLQGKYGSRFHPVVTVSAHHVT